MRGLNVYFRSMCSFEAGNFQRINKCIPQLSRREIDRILKSTTNRIFIYKRKHINDNVIPLPASELISLGTLSNYNLYDKLIGVQGICINTEVYYDHLVLYNI